MPIGTNAIKRVTNNGYSNVKTSAPDMENSAVVEKKATVETKKTTATVSTKTTKAAVKTDKKPAVKKAAVKKSMETEPELALVKTLEKVIEKPADASVREGDGYINLGGTLPYYLL